MNNEVQVVLSPKVYMTQIAALQEEIRRKDYVIQHLTQQLVEEQALRKGLEEQAEVAQKEAASKKKKLLPQTKEYSDFKSDGRRKPHAADSIRSYDDFCAIQKYFLDNKQVRDWAMWTVGVSLGLRISDLLSLKFGHFLEADKRTFKPRLRIYEQKTGKANDLLITEAVKETISKYIEAINFRFELDEYLFPSKKTHGKMYEEHGWRILSKAGKSLGLPLSIGSHTMRKSFANIAACVDRSCVDMNSIVKVQGLLNHSDQKVTMRYLGAYQDMYDRARIAVSDFVLGKTGVNEIIAGSQFTNDDLMERLEALEKILRESKGAGI